MATTSYLTYIDKEIAQKVVGILRRERSILGIEVFGSVARDGVSMFDLDLIITTDEFTAETFIEQCCIQPTPSGVYFDTGLRFNAAEIALGNEFAVLLEEAKQLVYPHGIDIFVFPSNWRDRLSELQRALDHSDPDFMRHIVIDARDPRNLA